ncbi:PAS domain-containing protein [bacterium]|nr:PAS domain-containing protein [bacterium]
MNQSYTRKKRPGLFLIWLLVFIFAIIVATVNILWPFNSKFIQTQTQDLSSIKTASSLLDEIERIYYDNNIEILSELSILSELDKREIEKKSQPWLARHPEIITATLWYPNKRWPTRFLCENFWSQINQMNLDASNQSNLLSQLLEQVPPSIKAGETVVKYFTPASNRLQLLQITKLNENKKIFIQIKFDAQYLSSKVNALFSEQEAVCIKTDSDLIITSTDGVEFPQIVNQMPVKDSKFIWERLEFMPEKWQLIYGQKRQPVTQTSINPWPVIGLITLVIAALFLARLIYNILYTPITRLAESVTALAQGHFDSPLPPENNPDLDHLVKLFNYMAGEMDRFQRINVHEIIHDKHKTETMLRNIADGVLVTDHQDRIVIVNAAAEKWLGKRQNELIGASLIEHVHDHALIDLVKSVRHSSDVQSAEFEMPVENSHRKIIIKAHSAPFEIEMDKGQGVVTAMRDITLEKEADQIKTELVSMVAHELKSPLTSIYGFSELLLDSTTLNVKEQEYAQVILTESERLADLINKFLDLARLESGKTTINTLPFDLSMLIEKVVEVHKGQAVKKRIKIITQLPEQLPLADGDQDMIEQVLVNLFSNAVKYSPLDSKIGFEVKNETDMLVVSIIDNGYGIPKESLKHVFDKFYRVVENEALDETEGSGLGLTLAKEIIEQHGGTIKVSSRLGVGSVFTFLIPKAKIDASNFNELTI